METKGENSTSKRETALAYAKEGWPVLPLHSTNGDLCTCRDKKSCGSKGKHPRTRNGIKDATKSESQIRIWWERWPEANIGLVTGRASGRIVLDIDIKNGKKGDVSLQALIQDHGPLPDTLKAITASGGEHYVFRMTERPIKSRTGVEEGIDLLADDRYFVASPSVIKGKSYSWVNDAKAAPCPDWVAHLGKEELTSESRIARIIKEILPLGKERKGNWRVRCPFPTPTHTDTTPSFDVRLSDGVFNCFGCPQSGRIEELYAHIKNVTVEEARRIIYPPAAYIEELNKTHAVITDFAGKCVILNESVDPLSGWKKVTCSSLVDLRGRYRSREKVLVGQNYTDLGNAWFGHRDRREYPTIVFAPGKATPGYYNLWQGLSVSPRPGDCHLFLQHIHDNISSKDAVLYQYVINWMALLIQRPWERPGVALVLRGSEGVGKGMFCSEFGKLFGPHFKHVWSTRQLVGNFNAHLADALLVFADEALWAGDKAGEGVLKALITERTMPLEYKGKDLVHVDNHVHLIISTNNQWAVPAGPNARRYCVIDVSNARMQDTDYFGAIQQEMDNGGREALAHMLLNVNLNGVNLRKFPVTDALNEMKRLTMPPTYEFWLSILERGTLGTYDSEWKCRIAREDLHQQYSDWAKLGMVWRPSQTKLGSALKKICPHVDKCWIPSAIGGRSKIGWDFGDLKRCRDAFCQFYNWPTHDWDPPEEPESGPPASVGSSPVSISSEPARTPPAFEEYSWDKYAEKEEA